MTTARKWKFNSSSHAGALMEAWSNKTAFLMILSLLWIGSRCCLLCWIFNIHFRFRSCHGHGFEVFCCFPPLLRWILLTGSDWNLRGLNPSFSCFQTYSKYIPNMIFPKKNLINSHHVSVVGAGGGKKRLTKLEGRWMDFATHCNYTNTRVSNCSCYDIT